jgi:predicted ferric reductase
MNMTFYIVLYFLSIVVSMFFMCKTYITHNQQFRDITLVDFFFVAIVSVVPVFNTLVAVVSICVISFNYLDNVVVIKRKKTQTLEEYMKENSYYVGHK